MGSWKWVFRRRRWNGYRIDYNWAYKDINRRRPPVTFKRAGHGPSRDNKPRPRTRFFNNEWQENRYLTVKNLGFVESCQERGINVVEPQSLFTPHLPQDPTDYSAFEGHQDVVKKPFEKEEEHPYYHERPAYSYLERTYFPKDQELDTAKVLLKTVQIEEGLPEKLVDAYQTLPDHLDVQQVIKESQMFDATQKKLPRNVAVPYIGWHPVEDRMFRKMPYDVTTFSWGRNTRKEYGIPINRKK